MNFARILDSIWRGKTRMATSEGMWIWFFSHGEMAQIAKMGWTLSWVSGNQLSAGVGLSYPRQKGQKYGQWHRLAFVEI
jgi:hypothetical protein